MPRSRRPSGRVRLPGEAAQAGQQRRQGKAARQVPDQLVSIPQTAQILGLTRSAAWLPCGGKTAVESLHPSRHLDCDVWLRCSAPVAQPRLQPLRWRKLGKGAHATPI